MKNDSLGDRCKKYEEVTRHALIPRMPVIVRLDGRAFHTFTRGFLPFDEMLQSALVEAAREVSKEMQGFEIAYHQSDEVSFLMTDYETLTTERWFDGIIQKIASVSASIMTAHFNHLLYARLTATPARMVTYANVIERLEDGKLAYFDARVYNVPKEDVANVFLWRCKDWQRNSVQMLARQWFSHKELNGKKIVDINGMLSSIGQNWESLPDKFKYGTFILPDKEVDNVPARYVDVAHLIDPLIHKDKDAIHKDVAQPVYRLTGIDKT